MWISSSCGHNFAYKSCSLVKAIQNGEAYVNVHTAENPDGAIRGQIAAGGAR